MFVLKKSYKFFIFSAAIASVLQISTLSEARARGGMGSRGSFGGSSRSYSTGSSRPGSVGNTAPRSTYQDRAAARSAQPNNGWSQPAAGAAGAAGAAATGGGMFGRTGSSGGFFRSMAGGLAGGFLGSMLFSSFGSSAPNGMMGGGYGGGRGIGFFEILLLLGVVFIGIRLYRKNSSWTAKSSIKNNPDAPWMKRDDTSDAFSSFSQPKTPSLGVLKGATFSSDVGFQLDYAKDTFYKIQDAWQKQDLRSIYPILSTNMSNELDGQLAQLRQQGHINQLDQIAIDCQVENSWRDYGTEYCTVKIQGSMVDLTLEASSRRVVAGDPNRPEHFTEFWTFFRQNPSQPWILDDIEPV